MKKIIISICLLISSFQQAFSQATKADPKDAEGWYSASLKLDLPRKWESNLTYEFRYYNNLKTYYGSYISLSGTKAVSKIVKMSGEYRIAFLNKGLTHRYTLGIEGAWKIKKKLELSGRFQLQNRIQDSYDPLEMNDKTLFWRVKAQAKYPLNKKLDVYASVEPIMEFAGDNFVDNWRNIIGIKYKIYKRTKLDLSYLYRPDYGKKTYNRYYNILNLNVTYNLKIKEKNKKNKKKK